MPAGWFYDEVFQSFVPGRGGQVSDVFIDSAGALLGLGIYFAATRGMRAYQVSKGSRE
jgi:VanZ family protein